MQAAPLPELHISQFQDQGKREEQQDFYRVIENFTERKHLTLCLVADGHGGSAAAAFLHDDFPMQLELVINEQFALPVSMRIGFLEMLGKALEQSIASWDKRCFGEWHDKIHNDADKEVFFNRHRDHAFWEKHELESGSTFVCVLFDLKKLKAHCINLGDSRAAWILNDKTIGQTVDHCVKRKMSPITGFSFSNNDGVLQEDLAMSRAVGDNTQRLFGVVSRQYDLTTINLIGQTTFRFVIASDGLFDVFSDSHSVLYETFEDATEMAGFATTTIRDGFQRHLELLKLPMTAMPPNIQFEDNVSIIYVKFSSEAQLSKPRKPHPSTQDIQEATQLFEKLTTVMQKLNLTETSPSTTTTTTTTDAESVQQHLERRKASVQRRSANFQASKQKSIVPIQAPPPPPPPPYAASVRKPSVRRQAIQEAALTTKKDGMSVTLLRRPSRPKS
jgi:serine/threonine protein phosphatase PrpC